MGESAIQAAAPHLLNELPLQLRTVGSVEPFMNSTNFSFKAIFSIVVQVRVLYSQSEL